MKYFVNEDSIVRKIWGSADTILFIFAGSSAEFALNKAVDWLYFTGKLPADPLGRLFSTVDYARQIVFSEHEAALKAIDKITMIHRGVEKSRGAQIPDWAYRDVLFMLVDYSIRAFEVLERKLTESEKAEIFTVFNQVGLRMGIAGLPTNYTQWKRMREEHMQDNLTRSNFTIDLYEQYKKHLGTVRYLMLRQVQILVVPKKVNQLLTLGQVRLLTPVLLAYKITRVIKLEKLIRNLVLPQNYKSQVVKLDIAAS